MSGMGRYVPNLVRTFGLSLAIFLSASQIASAQGTPSYSLTPPRAGVSYLDQGWGSDTAIWWYHVSQGTVFMPYEWFISLEQASGDALFASSDHLERLGFLADPASATNPRGLPVGFSIRELALQKPPYQYWKGELGCPFCWPGSTERGAVEQEPTMRRLYTFSLVYSPVVDTGIRPVRPISCDTRTCSRSRTKSWLGATHIVRYVFRKGSQVHFHRVPESSDFRQKMLK